MGGNIRGVGSTQGWSSPAAYTGLTGWLRPTVTFVTGAGGSWKDSSAHSFAAEGAGGSLTATTPPYTSWGGAGDAVTSSALAPLSAFVTAAAFTVYVVVQNNTIFAPNVSVYQQPGVVADATASGGYFGLYAATNQLSAFVWDGVQKQVTAAVTNGTTHVIAMRLGLVGASSRLDMWIDLTKQVGVASGAIQVVSNPVAIATQWQTLRSTCSVGDVAFFNVAHSDGTVAALIQYFAESYRLFGAGPSLVGECSPAGAWVDGVGPRTRAPSAARVFSFGGELAAVEVPESRLLSTPRQTPRAPLGDPALAPPPLAVRGRLILPPGQGPPPLRGRVLPPAAGPDGGALRGAGAPLPPLVRLAARLPGPPGGVASALLQGNPAISPAFLRSGGMRTTPPGHGGLVRGSPSAPGGVSPQFLRGALGVVPPAGTSTLFVLVPKSAPPDGGLYYLQGGGWEEPDGLGVDLDPDGWLAWELGGDGYSRVVRFDEFARRAAASDAIHGEPDMTAFRAVMGELRRVEDKRAGVLKAIKIGGAVFIVYSLGRWLLL